MKRPLAHPARQNPSFLPKDILPLHLALPPHQNVPVDARPAAQDRRSPLAGADDAEFHRALDGLREAELPAQEVEFEGRLRGAPGREAGFEGVGGLGVGGGGVVLGGAQGVVDSRGGGRGGAGEGGGLVGGGGDDAEGLERGLDGMAWFGGWGGGGLTIVGGAERRVW